MTIGPAFNSILVSVTEACHVGCAHCGFIGSSREREAVAEEMASWIGQMGDYGVPTIIFTGGEAFERFEVLSAGVAAAKQAGQKVGIFTSSFWATSPEEAKRTLAQLDGLTTLYLSTDVYHQRRVPFSNVRNAIDAARDLGVTQIRLIITYANREDLEAVTAQYACYGDSVEIHPERVIPNPKFSKKLLQDQDALLGFEPRLYSAKCFLATPLLNPNGDLFACHIGKAAAHTDLRHLPYFLGNLRENSFARIMAAARVRADYQYLRTHGPRGVAEAMADAPEARALLPRQEFTCACDMCFSVLRTPEGAAALRTKANAEIEATDLRIGLLLEEETVFDCPQQRAIN